MPMANRKMKAWLVTWEWSGEHAKRTEKVAAIFNPRSGAERIRAFVEFLYLNEYTLSERMKYARHPQQNPYRAQFGALSGVPWTGQIYCGHNPYLFARLVDEVMVERDAAGKEHLQWKERSKPDISWIQRSSCDE